MKEFGVFVLVFLALVLIMLEFWFRVTVNEPAAVTVEDAPPTLLDNAVQAVKTAVPAIKPQPVETAVPVVQPAYMNTAIPVDQPGNMVETVVPGNADCSGFFESGDQRYYLDGCGVLHEWVPATTWEDYATRAVELGVVPDPKPTEVSHKASAPDENEIKSGKDQLDEAPVASGRHGRNGTVSNDEVPYAMLFGRDKDKDAKCKGTPQQFLDFIYKGRVVPYGWFDACGRVHDGVMPADVKTEKTP